MVYLCGLDIFLRRQTDVGLGGKVNKTTAMCSSNLQLNSLMVSSPYFAEQSFSSQTILYLALRDVNMRQLFRKGCESVNRSLSLSRHHAWSTLLMGNLLCFTASHFT